jgi:hypothetical protein
MTEAEAQLQNALINAFHANLLFLSEFDNELYLRIDGLSQAINSGLYEERYELEFLEEVGEFDIYDNKEQKYVYNKDPKNLKNKAKNLDFTSKGSFSNLKRDAFSGRKFDLKIDEPLSLPDSVKFIINQTSDYVDIFKDKIETYENKRYKEFSKVMVIGTLLGRHLLSVHEKLKPELYFICESNLEIFRLSLFVLDYFQLGKDGAGIIFSIMDDNEIFNAKCSRFLLYKPYTNYCIKFFTSDYNISELFDSIATVFSSKNPFAYNYALSLYNLTNNDSKIVGKYNRVKLKKVQEKLTNKPILFIGAGPSLTDNLDWLYENQNKFILISMAAALRKLIEYKIIPDIISTVDSGEKAVFKQFDFENNLDYIKDKIVFASSMTSHNILAKFKEENIFTFDVMSSFYTDASFQNAYSIGEMTLSWLLSLKCKEIYLLGIDLALNQETGETHIPGHYSAKKLDLENKGFFVEKGNFVDTDTMEVKGNFLEKVQTTRLFAMSLQAMNHITETLATSEQKLYNLSNHGAKINKAKPTTTDEIDLETIDKDFNEFKNSIVKVSDKSLSPENKKMLEEEENFLKEILYMFHKNKDKKFDYKEFMNFIKSLYITLNKNNTKMIASKRFLSLYFESQLMYICYCLNDKSLRKEKQKISKTINIMEKQLRDIVGDYLRYSKKVRSI